MVLLMMRLIVSTKGGNGGKNARTHIFPRWRDFPGIFGNWKKSFWGRFEQWIDDHCECKGRLLVPIVGIKAGLVRNKGWQGWKLEPVLQIKQAVYQTSQIPLSTFFRQGQPGASYAPFLWLIFPTWHMGTCARFLARTNRYSWVHQRHVWPPIRGSKVGGCLFLALFYQLNQ